MSKAVLSVLKSNYDDSVLNSYSKTILTSSSFSVVKNGLGDRDTTFGDEDIINLLTKGEV